MGEQKTETVSVPLTPALRAELDRIAAHHDVSLAHVIRRAIRFYLNDPLRDHYEGSVKA